MQSSGEEQQKDEKEREGGSRWKEESREVMQDGGRWRGGEEGGERWKEESGVIRRGQIVSGGARSKGEGGRRGGVSYCPAYRFVRKCGYQLQCSAVM